MCFGDISLILFNSAGSIWNIVEQLGLRQNDGSRHCTQKAVA